MDASNEDPEPGVFGSGERKKAIDADNTLMIDDYSNLRIIVFFCIKFTLLLL